MSACPRCPDPGGPTYLAVDSGFAYWFDSGTDQVMADRLIDGTPLVLASGETDPAYVTANDGTVYWTNPNVGTIWKVTGTGGIPSPAGELADGQNGPAYLAVDNVTVYWIDSGADTIMAVPAARRHPGCGDQFPLLRRVLPGGERIASNGQ